MQRVKSLIAAIFSTVVNAIQVFANGYTLFAFIAVLAGAGGVIDPASMAMLVMMLLLMLVIVVLCIVALVFSCKSFFAYKADNETFMKRKKVIITTVVLNFIIAALFLISCFGTESVGSIILYVISMVLLIAANVLYIIDMKQEKANTQKQTAQVSASVEQNTTEQEAPKSESDVEDIEKRTRG